MSPDEQLARTIVADMGSPRAARDWLLEVLDEIHRLERADERRRRFEVVR